MARSAASYGAAVFHAPQVRFIYSPFQMKQLHFIPLRSIVPLSLHNMKHSLRSYDEKMKNESFSAYLYHNPSKNLSIERKSIVRISKIQTELDK